MHKRKDQSAWRSATKAVEQYRILRALVQHSSNLDGYDRGIEANDLFRTWNAFILPSVTHRSGHELRCEVVSCEDIAKCQPGHGPRAGQVAS